MNKEPYRTYLQVVIEAMTKVYGDTLWDTSTDVRMAEAVIKALRPYLYFHPLKISNEEWLTWRKEFLEKLGIEDPDADDLRIPRRISGLG